MVAAKLAVKLAWTVDDAPTIARVGPVDPDPGRMDRIREAFLAAGIRHCVAFVVGERAEEHLDALERWLSAGYELGNHTHEHTAGSEVGADAFIGSVERCHRVLERVGAFDGGRTPWFRFPYLDRGPNPLQRRTIAERIQAMGYRIAHASFDTYDHLFEVPLHRNRSDRVVGRYVWAALESLRASRKLAARRFGRDIAHVSYGHFGLVQEHHGIRLIEAFEQEGAAFVSLEEAQSDSVYGELNRRWDWNGVALYERGAPHRRVLRRALRWTARRGLFQQEDLGPLLPHLWY
jgi:peptidoglycan/xylan/chitin deacetylase (PgdA/CDA1 family)